MNFSLSFFLSFSVFVLSVSTVNVYRSTMDPWKKLRWNTDLPLLSFTKKFYRYLKRQIRRERESEKDRERKRRERKERERKREIKRKREKEIEKEERE